VTFNTAWADLTAGTVNSAWVPTSTYGKPTSSANYGTARTITASAGFRF
jgi:hypothetical protein